MVLAESGGGWPERGSSWAPQAPTGSLPASASLPASLLEGCFNWRNQRATPLAMEP